MYNSFKAGLCVVCRSDRFWGGLSTDLIIEQVLMCNLTNTGGLTRGRGMILSMPRCTEIHGVMEQFTGIQFISEEQHVDVSES